jgi:uncharacterized protein YabE (DUF348 family)
MSAIRLMEDIKNSFLWYTPQRMHFREWVQSRAFSLLTATSGVLMLAGFSLMIHASTKTVEVVVDGESMWINTQTDTVGGVLKSANIEIAPEDIVIPDVGSIIEDGGLIHLTPASSVTLDIDGEISTVLTAHKSPANILHAAGMRLFPGDRVWVEGVRLLNSSQSMETQPKRLRIERAITLMIDDGAGGKWIRSAAATLGEALWEAGVILREGDHLDPGPETTLRGVESAALTRSRELVIEVDGSEILTRVVGPTVGEALSQARIALVGLDYTHPGTNLILPEEGNVEVIRVQEKTLVEMKPAPFETLYQPAPDLEIDNIEVVDPGKYGILANRVRIRLENGEEVHRQVDEAWQAVEPSPRILGYGTKIVVRTLNTSSGTIEYWRAVPVYATSYSPCNLGVDYCGDRTASGKKVKRGVIGVIRSWYNAMKGWPVYVPNYGIGSIEDIGGGIYGRKWIDLGFTDENYERWHSWTTLYFLTPVPPIEYITWILP